jgi:CBS-domain-containing membrane protein
MVFVFPGGATALIAVMGTPKIIDLGYMYVLVPVLSGATIMVLVAIVTNNLSPNRSYPVFWW